MLCMLQLLIERLRIFQKEIRIKCIINVNSSATGRSTIKAIRKVALKYNIEVSEKEFHTIGSWLNLHKGRPNEDDLNKLKDFVTNTINDLSE